MVVRGFLQGSRQDRMTIRWETSGYLVDWIDRAEDLGYRLSRYDNGVAVSECAPRGETQLSYP